MSYIDLIVERQIAEAIARGDMDGGPLKGKPLADALEMRQPGWWAEQLVRRERSRVVHEDAKPEYAAWRRRFWIAADPSAVTRLVADANAWVDAINAPMLDEDAFAPFDEHDILTQWRSAPRPSAHAPAARTPADHGRRRRSWFRRS